MSKDAASDDLNEIVVAGNSAGNHRRKLSDSVSRLPIPYSRDSGDLEAVDGRPLLRQSTPELQSRTQVLLLSYHSLIYTVCRIVQAHITSPETTAFLSKTP